LRARQPESVAKAVVGRDPALGQRRFDLAGGIEADQALRRRVDQKGGGGIERLAVGVDQPGRRADRADRDRAGLGLPACRHEQQGGEKGNEAVARSGHGRSVADPGPEFYPSFINPALCTLIDQDCAR
jgi:hypothetical protein